MSRPFVSGVVLAAGAAARMGRPKQLLPLRGRPLLQHVLDRAAASRLDEIVLVLGANAAAVRASLPPPAPRLEVVVNDVWAEGIASSLRCGLRACDPRSAAAAILLGDQPGVTSALIDAVLDELAATRAAFVRPVFHAPGREPAPGHPVAIARSEWADVERLRGDEGARVLLARAGERVHELRVDAPAPLDVDTEADYERTLAEAPA